MDTYAVHTHYADNHHVHQSIKLHQLPVLPPQVLVTGGYFGKLGYRTAQPIDIQHHEDQSDPDRWMLDQPEVTIIHCPLETLSYT